MTLSESVDFLYGMLESVNGRLKNSIIINIIVVSIVVVVVVAVVKTAMLIIVTIGVTTSVTAVASVKVVSSP